MLPQFAMRVVPIPNTPSRCMGSDISRQVGLLAARTAESISRLRSEHASRSSLRSGSATMQLILGAIGSGLCTTLTARACFGMRNEYHGGNGQSILFELDIGLLS